MTRVVQPFSCQASEKKEEGRGKKPTKSDGLRAVQGDGGAAIIHPLLAGRALRDRERLLLAKEHHRMDVGLPRSLRLGLCWC